MGVADEDLKRQLDEAWAERDRARELQKSAEAQAASFLRQCMEIGALRLIDQGIADARALEIKNLTDAFRVRVEISDVQQAEIEGLKGSLSRLRGPECQDKECPDYDGEHPYHENVAVKAHERAQVPLREENEQLRADLSLLRLAYHAPSWDVLSPEQHKRFDELLAEPTLSPETKSA